MGRALALLMQCYTRSQAHLCVSTFPRRTMNESLVVIKTFESIHDADEAQAELLTAGIFSLVYTDNAAAHLPRRDEIALAVHMRDAQIAETLLAPQPRLP